MHITLLVNVNSQVHVRHMLSPVCVSIVCRR